MDVKGQAAVVTGGGSGLGAATARALAAAGAKVAVLDLRREAAEALAREIGGIAVACDVAVPALKRLHVGGFVAWRTATI